MQSSIMLLVIFIGVLLSSISIVLADNQNLSFILMVSSRAGLNTSQQVKIAVDEALKIINDDMPDILPGFSLGYTELLDNDCDPIQGMQFIQRLSRQQTLALIGGGCSLVTEQVVMIAHEKLIPVISYASISAVLDNSSTYPGLVRTIPSDSYLSSGIAGILNEFGWNQFAMITQSSLQYNETYRLLQKTLNNNNNTLTIAKHVTFTLEMNVADVTDNLFDTESHIFFLNCDPESAIQILCQAFYRGLYYPNYAWIILGWYQYNWWNILPSQCTTQQIHIVLNRSLTITAIPSQWTSKKREIQLSQIFVANSTSHTISSYAMDAIFTLALALNDTLPVDFNVTYSMSYNTLLSALKKSSFLGASGLVQYSNSGDRVNISVLIQQYQYSTVTDRLVIHDIGIFNREGWKYLNMNKSTVFPDGVPPDGTPTKVINTIKMGVFVFCLLLFFIGLGSAIVCLFFNIVFRNRKIVKLTSPNLNYIIVIGALMLLLGQMLYSIPSSNITVWRVFCALRRYFVSYGHDISFTLALMKTWRVHYIFCKPSPNKRAPKDWHLLLLVVAIISVDIFIGLALLIPDIYFSSVGIQNDKESSPYRNEQGVLQTPCIIDCGTTYYYFTWVVLTAIFKFTSHVIAIVLAFRIRNIEVDTVNDYKSTMAIIYSSSILIIILLLVIFALNDYVNVYATIVSVLIFLEVVIFLGFTFVPKMIALYKDPEGEHVFKKASSQPPGSSLSQPASNIQQISQTTPNFQNNMKESGIDSLADDQKRKETSTTLSDRSPDSITQDVRYVVKSSNTNEGERHVSYIR